MSDELDVDRGRLAEEVLNNPVYQDAYATIEAEVIKTWRTSRNTEDREQLHKLLGLLEKVKSAMETTMRSGKLAQEAIRSRQTLAERTIGRLRKTG